MRNSTTILVFVLVNSVSNAKNLSSLYEGAWLCSTTEEHEALFVYQTETFFLESVGDNLLRGLLNSSAKKVAKPGWNVTDSAYTYSVTIEVRIEGGKLFFSSPDCVDTDEYVCAETVYQIEIPGKLIVNNKPSGDAISNESSCSKS